MMSRLPLNRATRAHHRHLLLRRNNRTYAVGSFQRTELDDEYRPKAACPRRTANAASRGSRGHFVFVAAVCDIRTYAPLRARRSVRAWGLAGWQLKICHAR